MKHPTEAWQGQTRREEIIVDLLSRYHDLIAASVGGPGDGSGVPWTPPTYTRSVRKLEEALCELRLQQRSNWWHTTERFIRCERSLKELGRFRGRWIGLAANESVCSMPGGWTLQIADERDRKRAKPVEQITVTVVRWDPAVRWEKVRNGVGWVAARFDDFGFEPFVPAEVFEGIAA